MKISLASRKPCVLLYCISINTSDIHAYKSCKKSHLWKPQSRSPQSTVRVHNEKEVNLRFKRNYRIPKNQVKVSNSANVELFMTVSAKSVLVLGVACIKWIRLHSLKQYYSNSMKRILDVELDLYKMYKRTKYINGSWRNPAPRWTRASTNETYLCSEFELHKTNTSRIHSVGQFYFRAIYETYETKLGYETWVEFASIRGWTWSHP